MEKPVFKGGKIPSNLLVFGGRGWENAGHVGYGANAGREKQPETARSGAEGATGWRRAITPKALRRFYL